MGFFNNFLTKCSIIYHCFIKQLFVPVLWIFKEYFEFIFVSEEEKALKLVLQGVPSQSGVYGENKTNYKFTYSGQSR